MADVPEVFKDYVENRPEYIMEECTRCKMEIQAESRKNGKGKKRTTWKREQTRYLTSCLISTSKLGMQVEDTFQGH